jgi:hypothetical protein
MIQLFLQALKSPILVKAIKIIINLIGVKISIIYNKAIENKDNNNLILRE